MTLTNPVVIEIADTGDVLVSNNKYSAMEEVIFEETNSFFSRILVPSCLFPPLAATC